MIGRDVECFEVMEVVFDLGPGGHIEAGSAKQLLDPQPGLGYRMQATALLAASGQRDIDPACREFALDLGLLERNTTRIESVLHALLRLIDSLPGRRTFGSGQRTERFQLLGESALFAEPTDSRLIERREVTDSGDLVERLPDEGTQVVHDRTGAVRRVRGRSLPVPRWRQKRRRHAWRDPQASCDRPRLQP